MSNASKMNDMNPEKFLLELQDCAFIADSALKETKSAIFPYTYKTLQPKNKVLANKIFFKNMFSKYMEFLDRKLDNEELQKLSNETNDFPKISTEEYKKRPKRYRGIFTPFDKEHYVLRSQDEARPVVSTNKSNKDKLEHLLEYANTLTEKLKISYGKLFLKFVSKKQFNTVAELHKTFMAIDDITRIYMKEILVNKYDDMARHGAIDVYMEYQNELTNKNRYTNAQNAINNAKAEKSGLEYLAQNAYQDDKKGLEILLKRAVKNYEIDRNKIIASIKNNRTR